MHFPIGSEIENGLQAMFDTVVVLMSLTTIMIAVWYILWGCQDFSKNPESMCTKKGMPTKQATSAMSKPHSVIDIAAVEGQKGDCEAKGHVPYVFTSIEKRRDVAIVKSVYISSIQQNDIDNMYLEESSVNVEFEVV
ncbi:hypothetical protein AXG93_2138s1020 [Marchantia polymorpha subsp. ruderalis]|uniref:Uncharacterized protein n=1 Tax=Marchantia polymorpha subsp. ruderalis TaxID=1480154 RepID=A0A176WTE7_MARPO|nr:hypothetical protein AXG93_2138s1020 [Marchantia polymorpha subsp. ruderalis]